MFNTRNDILIKELRSKRALALSEFNSVSTLKNEKLAEFFYCKFKTGQDVPYSLLVQIPENEAIPLPVVHGGVIITTRVANPSPSSVIYKTNWTAGSTLTWHYHSDCNETIVVKKGMLKVYSDNSITILREGQSMEIAYGIGHQITALEESELDIHFLRINL